jgi:MFS family permease
VRRDGTGERGPVPGGPRRRRRAGAALGLLALALTLSMSTWFSASAVLPQLREDWGLSTAAGSWLTISVQLGFVAGALLSSALTLTDVLPPHRTILVGALGAATANLLLLTASGAAGAIPLRALTGFFLAGVYPPAFKLMATWFRRGRGTALGVLAGAIALGSSLPHLVNGIGGVGWRPVVVATSLLTALGGGLAALGVPEGPYPFPRGAFDPRQIGLVFRNRGVRLASLGYFGHMWELFAMWTWFLIFTREELLEGRAAALATFAVIAAGGAGCVLGGLASDRWGRAESTLVALAVSGLCALTIAFLPTPLALAVGVLWGASVIADSAQFSTLVTEHAEQAYVGTALTLQLATGFALTAVTIWLVPLLVDAGGWPLAFAVLAAGPAFGVAAMLRLRTVDRAAAAA